MLIKPVIDEWFAGGGYCLGGEDLCEFAGKERKSSG
jgi:hypothetical protein